MIPDYLSLEPVNNEEFSDCCYDSSRLRLGHLRFDERSIGYSEIITTKVERITDKDFLNDLEGFRDGVRITTEHRKVDLGRIIMLYGCPDKETAKIVYEKNGRAIAPVKRIEE